MKRSGELCTRGIISSSNREHALSHQSMDPHNMERVRGLYLPAELYDQLVEEEGELEEQRQQVCDVMTKFVEQRKRVAIT